MVNAHEVKMNRDIKYILGFSILTVFLILLVLYGLNSIDIKAPASQTTSPAAITSPMATTSVTVIKEASIDNGKVTCYYTENEKSPNVLNCIKNW
jgi:hypothetical protein